MPSSFAVSIEPIIHCLAGAPPAELRRSLSDDDWETIVVTAIALGLAPLLQSQLDQLDLTPPPRALAKLAVTRQAHTKRNQAIAGQLAELLAVFTAQNIKVIVLKGALLAPTVYPEPGLRPMNDIDLLFQPEDLAQVGPLLERLGYRGKHKSANQGPGVTKHLSTYRRDGGENSTPNPYLSAAAERTVEPHGSLEESWFGLTVDITPGVWDRAAPLSLHGQPAYRLSTNDLLLHLAVHATFHLIMGAAVFVQLYDLKQVVATWGHELDWPQLMELAGRARVEPFLYAALYWTRQLYRTPIPPDVLTALAQKCPPDLIAYVQSLAAVGLFERSQQPPLQSLGQRLRRGLSDRRETARWAGSWPAKWKVWQTALAFYKTDTANLWRQKLKIQA